MRILLDVGTANVNGLTGGSYTALHGAAMYGRQDPAALLIERGAKVSLANAYGNTPLDYAHSKEMGEMVAFLKSKGAKLGSELLPAPQAST